MTGRSSPSPSDSADGKAPETGAFAGVSLFSAAGVLVTKTCCFLPLLLAATGTGSFWLSQTLTPYEPYFLAAAAGGLALAWLHALRRWRSCGLGAACRRLGRQRGTLVILSVATAVTLVTVGWDAAIHPLIHPEAPAP